MKFEYAVMLLPGACILSVCFFISLASAPSIVWPMLMFRFWREGTSAKFETIVLWLVTASPAFVSYVFALYLQGPIQ